MKKDNVMLYAIGALLVFGCVVYVLENRPEPVREEHAEVVNEIVPETANNVPSAPTNTSSTPASTSGTSTGKKPVVTATDEKVPNYYITIDNSKGAVDPETYQVKSGKHIVMRVTTGTSDTLLVKGINTSTLLRANTQGTLEFDVETPGLYEIRLVDQGVFLGYVEVIPAS